MTERSAIVKRTVPPETFPDGEEITCPASTFRAPEAFAAAVEGLLET
jgi:hypothetical protein